MVSEKILLHEDENYKAWVKMSEQVKKEHAQEKRAAQRVEKMEQAREFFRGIGQKVLWVTGVAEHRKRKEREAARKLREEQERQQQEQYEARGENVLEVRETIGGLDGESGEQRDKAEQLSEPEHVEPLIDEYTREAFLAYMDSHRERVREQQDFEAKRTNEERILNERLTSIEELAAAAESGIQADTQVMEYDGREVPVYNMKGYPVAMLSHDVGFSLRGGGGITWDSVQKAQEVMDRPEVWLMSKGNRRGIPTLSTSYFNTETMSKPFEYNGRMYDAMQENLKTQAVRYGWSYVKPNSLVKISTTDGAVVPTYDEDKKFRGDDIASVDDIEQHKDFKGGIVANEVAMLRYDEQGKPMPPDYLITLDGEITQDTLRHAAFFKVPIVNIETEYYDGRKENESRINVERNKEKQE